MKYYSPLVAASGEHVGVVAWPGALFARMMRSNVASEGLEVDVMIRGQKQHVVSHAGLIALIVALVGLMGCATSGPTTHSEESMSNVLGTWTYRTSGSQLLSRGTFQLTSTQGRLVGRLRDSELGTVSIHGRMYGERLTLRMDLFRLGPVSVSGQVRDDQFRGLVDRPTYDVSMNQAETSRSREVVRGSFLAKRHVTLSAAALPPLNCPTLHPDGLRPCR